MVDIIVTEATIGGERIFVEKDNDNENEASIIFSSYVHDSIDISDTILYNKNVFIGGIPFSCSVFSQYSPSSEPAIVQTSNSTINNVTSSITLTLSSEPEPGNILLIFVGANQHLASRSPTPPDSTWIFVGSGTSLQSSQYIYWHKVSEGDPSSYTFLISGTAEYNSAVMYEIEKSYTDNPINAFSIKSSISSNSVTTNEVTPTILGTKAISSISTVFGAISSLSVSGVSSGWSLDVSAPINYESTFGASRIFLTSDSSTPISNTFSLTALSGGATSSIVLISPNYRNIVFFAMDVIEVSYNDMDEDIYTGMSPAFNTSSWTGNRLSLSKKDNHFFLNIKEINAENSCPKKNINIMGSPMALGQNNELMLNKTNYSLSDVDEYEQFSLGGSKLTYGRIGNKNYLIVCAK